MKTNNIIKIALIAAVALLFISCDKFLSDLPDNRTEIDTPDKISDILISAYPEVAPYGLMELMSDNVTDAGQEIGEGNRPMADSYRFQTVESTSYDSPHWIWEDTYKAIASANVALQAAAGYEDQSLVSAQIGEAYMCRAFSHFLLCNLFCQAYNPETGATDLGIPYVTEPETTVFVNRDRETVAAVYEKIAADIEAGFPLLSDSGYSAPMYHFTRRAAAAFAAQFYLYYGKYEKVIDYADYVLGDNPEALYRNWELITGTNTDEIADKYISTTEGANVFLHGFTSLFLRYRGQRYVHTNAITKETCASKGPWGEKLKTYGAAWGFGNYRHYALPKIREYFLVTDPIAYVGEPFIVKVAGSTERALIDRAEAYAMMKEYKLAADDLCRFYACADSPVSKSAPQISDFYDGVTYSTLEKPTVKKTLASRFPIEPGMQENLIHACLHARRIVTLEEGDRLMDLKRYGIAYTHVLDGEDNIQIEPYDKRHAVQIPDMAIRAGLTANPR